MALEVHLPQIVGRRMLEALPRLGRLGGGRCDQTVTAQDGMHGADGWHRVAQHLQPTRQLACPPGWMLHPQPHDQGLDL